MISNNIKHNLSQILPKNNQINQQQQDQQANRENHLELSFHIDLDAITQATTRSFNSTNYDNKQSDDIEFKQFQNNSDELVHDLEQKSSELNENSDSQEDESPCDLTLSSLEYKCKGSNILEVPQYLSPLPKKL